MRAGARIEIAVGYFLQIIGRVVIFQAGGLMSFQNLEALTGRIALRSLLPVGFLSSIFGRRLLDFFARLNLHLFLSSRWWRVLRRLGFFCRCGLC